MFIQVKKGESYNVTENYMFDPSMKQQDKFTMSLSNSQYFSKKTSQSRFLVWLNVFFNVPS